MHSTGSLWPMTPVEATSTCSAEILRTAAAAFASRTAFSMPSGAQALAFPEFAMMALAAPPFKAVRVNKTGAAFTRFVV